MTESLPENDILALMQTLQNLVSCCDTQSNGGVPHGSILGPLIDLIHASLVTV